MVLYLPLLSGVYVILSPCNANYAIGNSVESFGLSAEDIRCDFDPNTYDSTMKRVFGDEYYEGTEEEDKPEFSDLEIEDGGEHQLFINSSLTVIPR